jgi:hypothetical protein
VDDTRLSNGRPQAEPDPLAGAGPLVEQTIRSVLEQHIASVTRPPTMQALRPQVAAIAMQRRDRGRQALPNISDGHETYELVLTVAQTRGRWLVSNVSSPR